MLVVALVVMTFVNVCVPDQVLALARLSEAKTLPLVGVMVSEPSAFETDETPETMPSVDVEMYSHLPLASERSNWFADGCVEVPMPPLTMLRGEVSESEPNRP